MEKLELIRRNIIEVIEESELDALLKEKKSPSVYCGYETSGPVHIGTMLSVNKLIDFQDAGLKVKALFADLHTWLNRKGDTKWIETAMLYWQHAFKALGLKKAEYVTGSSFELTEKYIRDLFSFATNTTINRALRSMQQVARDIENAHVSQVLYPLMQSLDIAHMEIDIAFGGIEQRKIHMIAREELPKLGYKKPVCLHNPLMVSLKGPEVKMSSSDPATMIEITEDPAAIKKKINSAYCTTDNIAGNPVLQIAHFHIFPKLGKLKIERDKKYGGDREFKNSEELTEAFTSAQLHPADLKAGVSSSLSEILKPVRAYFEKTSEAQKALDFIKKK
ncbi:MAG: tyrosine--tRNA ligase [archaeon]